MYSGRKSFRYCILKDPDKSKMNQPCTISKKARGPETCIPAVIEGKDGRGPVHQDDSIMHTACYYYVTKEDRLFTKFRTLLGLDTSHLISITALPSKSTLRMKKMQIVPNNLEYHYSLHGVREHHIFADTLEVKVLKPSNFHGARCIPFSQQTLRLV